MKQRETDAVPVPVDTIDDDIYAALRVLQMERDRGDPLKIDLAEAALNDLLDRRDVTVVTRNNEEGNEQ